MRLQTGCKRIDDMLNVDTTQPALVCEFAGLPASGKTQLAHWASLFTLASSKSSKVVYIDSGGHFSPKRIKSFWTHKTFSNHRQAGVNLEDVLQRLVVYSAFDAQDLQELLTLGNNFLPLDCCLVIIDSISDILGPLSGSQKGQKMINSIGYLIKQLPKTRQIPVIVVNGSVSSNTWATSADQLPHISKGQLDTQSKPALGASWNKHLSKRLYFTPSNDRLNFHTALLSGSSSFDWDSDVLSYEEGGKIYSVVESLVELNQLVGNIQQATNCNLYIGKFHIFTN